MISLHVVVSLTSHIKIYNNHLKIVLLFFLFRVRWADTDCNSKQGIGATFDVMLSGYDPHVIIGPICSLGKYSSDYDPHVINGLLCSVGMYSSDYDPHDINGPVCSVCMYFSDYDPMSSMDRSALYVYISQTIYIVYYVCDTW